MPQLIMADMSQFSASQQQMIEQAKPQVVAAKAKVTKVRRARQSRNPQLSVARRNERERNRVKMVNNGFAVLRDHLPVEYLALVNGTSSSSSSQQKGSSESGCDTPDVLSVGGDTKSPCPSTGCGKNKKFSKVETLRAAIQHIKTLLQLLKESDPTFESIKQQQQHHHHQQQQQQVAGSEENSRNSQTGAYDDIEDPLSIASSSQQQQQQQQMSFQVQYQSGQQARLPVAGEQFVKLEPTRAYQQQQLSPFETAQTTIITTTTNSPPVSSHSYQQSPVRAANDIGEQQQAPASEHTHLWIQQHQNSFIEQQQQQQQQQQYIWSPCQQSQQYTPDTTQTRSLRAQHPQMPSPADSQAGAHNQTHYHHQQHAHQQDQAQFHSHQQQLDSPPEHWFTPSPTSQTMMQQQQQQHQQVVGGALQHQISLYSQ